MKENQPTYFSLQLSIRSSLMSLLVIRGDPRRTFTRRYKDLRESAAQGGHF
ncbi:uncharacterized protein PHALS_03440 [Plasmopara halstedii]|uniref:Uncharacterized protein n=1 Tax=Plasmopara halstedii TaxID=4781 RepID=A0A0P1AWK5_PLAHL|nr:uncharacterized protein PHALS_03440 [Plasmopara halstedii]CEG46758.1 hypothetical protein PHALS_03440 [Plasmopara halstedii]|eukprot:XP_024583127.1 hypothetical protein PHALS_03440 [Plasmopara halstedii]